MKHVYLVSMAGGDDDEAITRVRAKLWWYYQKTKRLKDAVIASLGKHYQDTNNVMFLAVAITLLDDRSRFRLECASVIDDAGWKDGERDALELLTWSNDDELVPDNFGEAAGEQSNTWIPDDQIYERLEGQGLSERTRKRRQVRGKRVE